MSAISAANLARALDGPLAELIELQRAAGLAISVTRGDELLFARTLGVMDAETDVPVVADTVFACASVTKLFTATAVMQLAEQGGIEIDQPVITYLPEFRLIDERYRAITVAHLLSHTSGIPDYDVFTYHHDPQFDDGALRRYVRGLGSQPLTLNSVPGERCRYCNRGYSILGELIATLSGQSYEAYVTAHILAPLGMRDSTLIHGLTPKSRLAAPHVFARDGRVVKSDVYAYNRSTAPDGALLTTLPDLTRWLQAAWNRGAIEKHRVLQPATIERMWNSMIDSGERFTPQMGLGWKLRTYRDQLVVGHGGLDLGFRAGTSMMPASGLSVTVLMNSMWGPSFELINAAFDVAMGHPAPRLIAPLNRWPTFTGRFQHEVRGEVRVEFENDTLWLEHGDTRCRMMPTGPDAFTGPAEANPFTTRLWALRMGPDGAPRVEIDGLEFTRGLAATT